MAQQRRTQFETMERIKTHIVQRLTFMQSAAVSGSRQTWPSLLAQHSWKVHCVQCILNGDWADKLSSSLSQAHTANYHELHAWRPMTRNCAFHGVVANSGFGHVHSCTCTVNMHVYACTMCWGPEQRCVPHTVGMGCPKMTELNALGHTLASRGWSVWAFIYSCTDF